MLSKLQKFVFSATLTYSSTSKKNKKDNFGKVSLQLTLSHYRPVYCNETTARWVWKIIFIKIFSC